MRAQTGAGLSTFVLESLIDHELWEIASIYLTYLAKIATIVRKHSNGDPTRLIDSIHRALLSNHTSTDHRS